MDKPELMRTMREAHQRMADAIEHLTDERLLEPAMDNWSCKDLLAHMAWWHDHSVLVIEGLRAGRQPYDGTDPENATDAINERTRRDHLDDPPELTRRAFSESFTRLLAALEPVTDEELFAADRWPWLGVEALVETVLFLAPLRRASRAPRTAFPLSRRKRLPSAFGGDVAPGPAVVKG